MAQVQAIRAPAPNGPHWEFQSGDGVDQEDKIGVHRTLDVCIRDDRIVVSNVLSKGRIACRVVIED